MPKARKELVIKGFDKGIGRSIHTGFQNMVGLDTTSRPGAITVNYQTVKDSSTTIADVPHCIISDNAGTLFAHDDDGYLYYTSGGTWTAADTSNTQAGAYGNQLAYWKNYVFAMGGTQKLEVYSPSGDSWTVPFQNTGGSDSNNHPMLVGQDDIVYVGSGNIISSLREKDGQTFDPSSGATYTYTATALDLPEDYVITSLAELDNRLLIGTQYGSGNNRVQKADIFPWDRLSQSFGMPLKINEHGINWLYTLNNLTYISAGLRSTIYVTDGRTVRKVRELPQHLFDAPVSTSYLARPSAVTVHDGRLHFAVNVGAGLTGQAVVYSLNGNKLVAEYILSTGNYADPASAININSLYSTGTNLFIGYKDFVDSSQGVDDISTNRRYTGYKAMFESPLYRVGSVLQPRHFCQLDAIFAKELATDEGIKVYYRINTTDSFTLMATIDNATYGAKSEVQVPIGITGTNLQIKCEMTTPSGSDSSPELIELRLR